MAKQTKSSATKVTRITATDSKPAKANAVNKPSVTKSKPAVQSTEQTSKLTTRHRLRVNNPLAPFWRYLKGSWYELRQVRWPDRRATWSMTAALLAFTLFFVIVILLLDAGFSELFKLILGK